MRRSHFNALRPICPLCRQNLGSEQPIAIASVIVERDNDIREGLLRCSSAPCQMEYPIIDGIPFLVANVRSFFADNLHHLVARTDLSSLMESVVGDAAGPGNPFDTARQHLSTYAWDHYGDLDPDPIAALANQSPGGVARCLERGIDLLERTPQSPALDIGCSVGRSTFELAARTDGLVLGIDLNVSMLRFAQTVLEHGIVRYPLRRVGIVYDRREYGVQLHGAERVDFWACDGLALPFGSGTFNATTALQVLDCTPSPLEMLAQLRRVSTDDATAILSTPYDWTTNATPIEAWVGGHSQRGENQGASEPLLRSLLTPGAHPQSIRGLEWTAEDSDFPWDVRLHDRSTMHYRSHLMVARTRKVAE